MKAIAKRKDNGELTYGNIFDTGEERLIMSIDYRGHWIDREVDPTTIEYEVNGEWLSEEAISERLEENTRLRAEVERLDELRRKERELTAMFDSDQRVAMALLDYVRNRLK